MSHAEFVNLTKWFAENVPHTEPALVLDHHREIASRPLAAILDELCRMEAGCLCGGMVELMCRLAQERGMEAYGMNVGQPDGPASHVVAVAKIENGCDL